MGVVCTSHGDESGGARLIPDGGGGGDIEGGGEGSLPHAVSEECVQKDAVKRRKNKHQKNLVPRIPNACGTIVCLKTTYAPTFVAAPSKRNSSVAEIVLHGTMQSLKPFCDQNGHISCIPARMLFLRQRKDLLRRPLSPGGDLLSPA